MNYAKQMRTTEENQRLQEKEANDGGYAESSFYENISNLSYIKDFHKAWGLKHCDWYVIKFTMKNTDGTFFE